MMRYTTFNILRSSSIGGRLHLNQVWENVRSGWLAGWVTDKNNTTDHEILEQPLRLMLTTIFKQSWLRGVSNLYQIFLFLSNPLLIYMLQNYSIHANNKPLQNLKNTSELQKNKNILNKKKYYHIFLASHILS